METDLIDELFNNHEIIYYKKCEFNRDQLDMISVGFKHGLTMEQIKFYANPKYDWVQMNEIISGFEHGLTIDQVKFYADPEFNWKKLFIRFGDLPKDNISKIHRGDEVVGCEKGVSVYETIRANGMFFPKLPNESEVAISDYFGFILDPYYGGERRPIYLVTGIELEERGTCGEPLLAEPVIIRTIYYDYL